METAFRVVTLKPQDQLNKSISQDSLQNQIISSQISLLPRVQEVEWV